MLNSRYTAPDYGGRDEVSLIGNVRYVHPGADTRGILADTGVHIAPVRSGEHKRCILQ